MECKLLGDIHGAWEYITKNLQPGVPLIQLGDFGFRRELLLFTEYTLDELMIVGGNHDEYPILRCLQSYLGDFGIIPGTEATMFCRGAASIDKDHRIPGYSWWQEEELTTQQGNEFLELYEKTKPRVMLSHTCPEAIVPTMFGVYPHGYYTDKLFDEAFKIHRPERWYFGHWHLPITKSILGCRFRCLTINEHCKVDLP